MVSAKQDSKPQFPTVVLRGRELSTPSTSEFRSATIFDIPNIFLMVLVKQVLCSSIEALMNSSMWSLTSSKNEASSFFFFRHEVTATGGFSACGFSDSMSEWFRSYDTVVAMAVVERRVNQARNCRVLFLFLFLFS